MENRAIKLSRNPLGIIALFILLIYSFATLLFGLRTEIFTDGQKWVFVGFLVGFPVMVLGVFTYLVINHHHKLYAPGDFKDEKIFLEINSPEETYLKNEKEISESQNEQDNTDNMPVAVKTLTQEQRSQLIKEQREKVNTIKRLVFEYYENKFDYVITRDVNYLIKSKKIYFDGVSEKNGSLMFLETKYITKGVIPRFLLKDIVFNTLEVKNMLQKSCFYQDYVFRLLFTFVVDIEEKNEISDLKQRIHSAIDTDLLQIGIRVLTLKDLENV